MDHDGESTYKGNVFTKFVDGEFFQGSGGRLGRRGWSGSCGWFGDKFNFLSQLNGICLKNRFTLVWIVRWSYFEIQGAFGVGKL